ncbi:YihY/virulence factor BrkB family protein [Chroococcus sp. FPU101]|uniref:YihY/virulence factor BrkB family protein n=1 Tax=Chroococcus sp. FPU101 TaxID=1974212 RepID=UPI001A907172|nr:YihY/virulence factor BrkB family protein [Chroococcus sp. FPU101]GFE70349.1 ribonuclease BN [Chroococcus sp. FPU101]
MSFKTLFSLLKETFQEWQEDNASLLASSLAYYTIFSLAPLLILVIAIVGAIFGEEAARGEIVSQIRGLVGVEGAKVIETAIANSAQPETSRWASFISVVVLFFGASGVFGQLQEALNTIWNVKAKPGLNITNLIKKRILSFTAVIGIGFLLLVSLVINAAISALNHYLSGFLPGYDFLWQLVNFLISFAVVTFLFALMYKFLPDVHITWRDVAVGAIITALLFTIGKSLLGAYLGSGSFGSTYGAAGSLVVLLLWVYYSAQILFFGAEFTQIFAKRYGSQIVPNDYAVKIKQNK